ncbi:hypothetical protein LTR85_012050 [Meristemomyces frigidus]|nr:hypothetical protein LTR85_012050 [Meristemomyces frigidus]
MPVLQDATIFEKQYVRYFDPPFGSADQAPYRDLTPHACDRAREHDSGLGRLAVELGVPVRENEIHPEQGDASDPNDNRPPLTEGPALTFEYDFGPYILRTAHVKDARSR